MLVACEFSGTVREAFIRAGHDAVSCDLLPTEIRRPKSHFQGDVFDCLGECGPFDLMIAHPPCTFLANSGVRWLYEHDGRWKDLIDGACFFRALWESDVPRIAIENPIMHKYAKQIVGVGPSQTVQPWQFGHGETKAVSLWLRNLPPLTPTEVVEGREPRVHHASPGPDRWKERSRFFTGIADAMAQQWGTALASAA